MWWSFTYHQLIIMIQYWRLHNMDYEILIETISSYEIYLTLLYHTTCLLHIANFGYVLPVLLLLFQMPRGAFSAMSVSVFSVMRNVPYTFVLIKCACIIYCMRICECISDPVSLLLGRIRTELHKSILKDILRL